MQAMAGLDPPNGKESASMQPEQHVSKEDTIKMLSILNGILLKSKYLDYNERHSTAVATVQRVADILNSPLFASLLDIREQWKKEAQKELSFDSEEELLTDFTELDSSQDCRQKSSASFSSTRCSPLLSRIRGGNRPNIDNSTVLVNTGAVLSDSNPDNNHKLSPHLAVDLYGGMSYIDQNVETASKNKKGKSKKEKTKGKQKEEERYNLRESSYSPISDEDTSLLVCESSLPSYPMPSGSGQYHGSVASPVATECVHSPQQKTDGFCKQNSLLETIHQNETYKAVEGKFGRGKRLVSLTQTKNGLGIEIAGLSQKGLFVSDVMSADGKQHLQIGDQVLKINGTSCAAMASFELGDHIEETPQGIDIILEVEYNLTGYTEYIRHHSR